MIESSHDPFRQQHKIVPAAQLTAIRERLREKTIVLCHGAFDLVHMGHLIHFEDARSLGDVLVVTIIGDRYITKKRSVSFTEEYRARQLAALEIVDYVAIIEEPSAATAIEALHPDIYVKGAEYAHLLLDKTANIFREKDFVERYGGRVHFTRGEAFSSTKLSHFLLASSEASQDNPLLRNERVLFRDLSKLGFTLEQLKGFVAGASGLRVCLLGETIIDEWVDVTVTNLSQKSRCVAGLETARSRQIGGAGGAALHLAGFVKEVHIHRGRPPEEHRVDGKIGRGDKRGFVDAFSIGSHGNERAERRCGGDLEPVGDRTCRTGPRRVGHSQRRPRARPRADQWGNRHRRIDGDCRADSELVPGAEDTRRAAAGSARAPEVAGRRRERIEPDGGLAAGAFDHGVFGLHSCRKP